MIVMAAVRSATVSDLRRLRGRIRRLQGGNVAPFSADETDPPRAMQIASAAYRN
jgi:hypothetical protein